MRSGWLYALAVPLLAVPLIATLLGAERSEVHGLMSGGHAVATGAGLLALWRWWGTAELRLEETLVAVLLAIDGLCLVMPYLAHATNLGEGWPEVSAINTIGMSATLAVYAPWRWRKSATVTRSYKKD